MNEEKREVEEDTSGKITSRGGRTLVYQCERLGQAIENVGDHLQKGIECGYDT